MVVRPTLKVRTRQTIVHETSMKPYVGFEHLTDVPSGFLYDIKRWSSFFDLKLPTMPRLSDPSCQGISESEFFKSGVGSKDLNDLKVLKILELFDVHERFWVPLVNHGSYFRYKTGYFYYSDESRVQYIEASSNRNSRNYIELDKEPDRKSPILAASFKRHPSTRTPEYSIKVQQCYKFTGNYSSGEELETVSDIGKITWANVDTNKKEFIVDNTIDGITRLFFNDDYIKTHGVVPTVYEDLGASSSLGVSTGVDYQVFYLPHFPVLADSSFHLYVADSSSWEEWNRVDSWWDLFSTTTAYPTDNNYFLDKDLGIVYFGSSTNGGVPQSGREIIVVYNETLRIEYEEIDRSYQIQAFSADTNPASQSTNQGFVCISHTIQEPTNIVLSIDKQRIRGTSPIEHGPILVGSDYGILKATVTGPGGIALPKIEVGFEMTPTGIGFLQGGSTANSITNGTGEAFTSYQPPVSAETLGYYSKTVRDSTNPYYPGSREVILKTSETGLTDKEDEIYLYQILKDDVLLGYKTIDDFLYQLYHENQPSWVVDAYTYGQWKQDMITKWDLVDYDETTPEGQPIEGRKVVIYQVNSVDNTDAYAIHPVTGELGAVVPLRPDVAELITDVSDPYYNSWRLIYPANSIPDCGTAESVGGYWVASSRLVTFQAHCWSPYYNRTIYSNSIMARISLPNYLLGEYLNDIGQKVPFGWKIITDDDNEAAGLDGATFITINPHHGPYPIIDLVNNTGATGDWADAPFRTVNFQFIIE